MARLKWLGVPHLPQYRGPIGGAYVALNAGDTIDNVSEADAAILLSDFKGIFVAATDKPEVDRQIKSAETRPVSAKRVVKK